MRALSLTRLGLRSACPDVGVVTGFGESGRGNFARGVHTEADLKRTMQNNLGSSAHVDVCIGNIFMKSQLAREEQAFTIASASRRVRSLPLPPPNGGHPL